VVQDSEKQLTKQETISVSKLKSSEKRHENPIATDPTIGKLCDRDRSRHRNQLTDIRLKRRKRLIYTAGRLYD